MTKMRRKRKRKKHRLKIRAQRDSGEVINYRSTPWRQRCLKLAWEYRCGIPRCSHFHGICRKIEREGQSIGIHTEK